MKHPLEQIDLTNDNSEFILKLPKGSKMITYRSIIVDLRKVPRVIAERMADDPQAPYITRKKTPDSDPPAEAKSTPKSKRR